MKPAAFMMRIMQVVFIVSIFLFIYVCHIIPAPARSVNTSSQYFIVLCAIASAASGFIVQRLMLRVPRQTSLSTQKSTPFSRWYSGHIFRFATAESVALFGFVLHMVGSPPTLVNLLFATALILQLIWQPGIIPEQTESHNSAR